MSYLSALGAYWKEYYGNLITTLEGTETILFWK